MENYQSDEDRVTKNRSEEMVILYSPTGDTGVDEKAIKVVTSDDCHRPVLPDDECDPSWQTAGS